MFFLMRRQPPRSTRTNTLVPYPTLFRSLLDCIDLTVSGGGARLRGTDLSAPLTRREAIEARLDFVAWFERDPLLRERVRDTLKRLPDVERALGRVPAGRGGPRALAQVRAGLEGPTELKPRLQATGDGPTLGRTSGWERMGQN